MDEIIALIKQFHRKRCYAMEARKRNDLSLGSHLRTQLGWRRSLPEAERKAIAAEAKRLAADPESNDPVIVGTRMAREPFDEMEKAATKEMARLAAQLPVWKAFGERIRGFGPTSLAIIVAEAGDLSNYATEAKLWKRMGVAVMDGVRQGSVPTNLTGTARKDAWIERGYSPSRRSRLFTIGDPLVKLNDGVYRAAYDRRRAHTQVTHPEWWVDCKGRQKLSKDGTPTSAHGALDAQRYMEKKLLRDLWRDWRRTEIHPSNRITFPVSTTEPATKPDHQSPA